MWPDVLAQTITALTPIVVPLLVAAAKKLAPKLPKALLPILAAALGVGLDQLNLVAAGQPRGVVLGALLGLAGVGLRELLDQVKKAGGSPTAIPGMLVVMWLASGTVLWSCERAPRVTNTTSISVPDGRCVVVVVINGTPVEISGKPGGNVQVGDTTYTIAPDCSEATPVIPPVVVAPTP